MGKSHSFRFLDDDLNGELIGLLDKAKIDYFIDSAGIVRYSADDEEIVENVLICSIRDVVFPSWQVVTCPEDWVSRYKDYMRHHDIPVREELSNGEVWFLIPRRYRPHLWKLDSSLKKAHPRRRMMEKR